MNTQWSCHWYYWRGVCNSCFSRDFQRIRETKKYFSQLLNNQGPVGRSLVGANRWLRGIKTYRFPWYLTLVSANHASSNQGQFGKCIVISAFHRIEELCKQSCAIESPPPSMQGGWFKLPFLLIRYTHHQVLQCLTILPYLSYFTQKKITINNYHTITFIIIQKYLQNDKLKCFRTR